MQSKITGKETKLLFHAKVLNKYDVPYYQCIQTGFIQAAIPYQLSEAYDSAIAKLDIGLVSRNMQFADRTARLLKKKFNLAAGSCFLDYAGGYGLFTRLMRDKGFNFYTTDPYCTNLFAEFHDFKDLEKGTNFELVTAFEVFEHLYDPLKEIQNMFQYSDNLLFSTEIQPKNIKKLADWWYFVPETGQHISFYTLVSLELIAQKLGKYFYSDGCSLHLFSAKKLERNPLNNTFLDFFIRKINRYLMKRNRHPAGSLLQKDWQEAKDNLFLS